jgi:uncharacterized Zn finger protein
MMMINPCPFCLTEDVEVVPLGHRRFSVLCNNCGACGPSASSHREAREKWDDQPAVSRLE